MGKIWIIVQREYITRVKRKSFIVTTLLAPLGFLLLMSSSVLINRFSQGKMDVAIVDETNLFKEIPLTDAEDGSVYFHKLNDGYASIEKEITGHDKPKYQAIIHIPADFDVHNPKRSNIAVRYTKRPGINKQHFINQSMNDAYQEVRLKSLNISKEQRDELQQKIELNFESLSNESENQNYTAIAGGVGMMMGFAIYISIFFYGTMIMKGVMEEKTNRIVEVLASSVKPFQLLMGKIIGVGAVGVTQFILWGILMAGTVFIIAPLLGLPMSSMQSMPSQPPVEAIDQDSVQALAQTFRSLPLMQILVFFPFYFLGGFLIYGSLFAAIGAAIGEDGDQQSLMIPVTVPIIISIFIAINVINNPDSALGMWGSLIPFTSPVVMSALLPFGPPWWQIALSLLFLVSGFVFTTFIAARIYRTGILMYGKKVKMKEIAKWIFSKA